MTSTDEELVHGEVDGLNASAASVAARALMAAEPAGAALADDLRRMDALFRQVEERVPSPHLRDAILAAVPPSGRTAPELAGSAAGWQGVAGWLSAPLEILERFIGGGVLTRKVMLLGMTGVAIIAIVGGSLITNAPSDGVAGTIGGDDQITGVQQASRYRGRSMSKRDVTLGDERVAVLLQNPDVRRILQKPEVQQFFKNEDVQQFFKNEDVQQFFKNEDVQQFFKNQDVQQFFKNDDLQRIEKTDGLQQFFKNEDVQQFFKNEDVQQFFKNQDVQQFFKNDNVQQFMKTENLGQIFQNDILQRVLRVED